MRQRLSGSTRKPNASERKVLAEVPPLTDDMVDALQCWHELESERDVQWVVTPASALQFIGPIPWRALDAWAARHSYSFAAFRVLVGAISYCDQRFMERQASERRTKGK